MTRPEIRTIEEGFAAVGTLLAARSIELRPLAPGRIEEVGVASGGEVAAGDLIFRLDNRAARAALDDAPATRGAYRRAEGTVSQAAPNLDDRRLLAPFAGVGIVDIDTGKYVDASTMFSTLDDLSAVQADSATVTPPAAIASGSSLARIA